MRCVHYLFLGVLLSMPVQAVLTEQECQKRILKCEAERDKVFEVSVKWNLYKNCLIPSVPVPGRCRGELSSYIATWNKFVDHCEQCVTGDSPLKGCALYDQNMLCPPKLKPLKDVEQDG